MKLSTYAKNILLGQSIEDKLLNVEDIEFDEIQDFNIPKTPGRSKKIQLSSKQEKFPKGQALSLDNNKAFALNSFANHELLALEMMACSLLIYPHHTAEMKRFKQGILKTLVDEQKHFKLYTDRMKEIGYEFGDFPLNDFFWRQMESLKTPEQYLSVIALTFESANLDFAHYYMNLFNSFDDKKTGSILKVVFDDELTHVAFGTHYMNLWKQDKSLWEYYVNCLPWPMTPARGKGIKFKTELRKTTNLDADFLDNLKNYQDDFSITKRSK